MDRRGYIAALLAYLAVAYWAVTEYIPQNEGGQKGLDAVGAAVENISQTNATDPRPDSDVDDLDIGPPTHDRTIEEIDLDNDPEDPAEAAFSGAESVQVIHPKSPSHNASAGSRMFETEIKTTEQAAVYESGTAFYEDFDLYVARRAAVAERINTYGPAVVVKVVITKPISSEGRDEDFDESAIPVVVLPSPDNNEWRVLAIALW